MLTIDPKSLSKAKFVGTVLWMEGKMPTTQIADRVNWTPGQFRGFVHRSFEKPRHHMTIEERQTVLDILNDLRGDLGIMGGHTFDSRFLAKPIKTLPVKKVAEVREAEQEPDPTTKTGRREIKRRKQAERARLRKDKERQEKRESGHAERRGINAAAVQWLIENGLLSDADERADSRGKKASSAMRRREAGERFYRYLQGASVTVLGALDYERATMGSAGSGPKLSLAAYRLHCIEAVGNLRQLLDQAEFDLIERVVHRDEFVWEMAPARSRERQKVYEAIRYLLDVIAVHESIMTQDEFRDRWGRSLPEIRRPNRAKATELSEVAEEFMREASR